MKTFSAKKMNAKKRRQFYSPPQKSTDDQNLVVQQTGQQFNQFYEIDKEEDNSSKKTLDSAEFLGEEPKRNCILEDMDDEFENNEYS